MNEEIICKIIAKVRQMYKYDKRLADILATTASIKGSETPEGKIEFSSITWSFYGNQIVAGRHRIVYSPEYGEDEELITYSDFNELISL